MSRIVSTTATVVLAAGLAAILTGCSGSDRPTADARTPATGEASGTVQVDVACDPLPDLPEGRIAYIQTREDGTDAVFLMKPDGTDRHCLVETPGSDIDPAWSPDGRWLAFVGGTLEDGRDVYVLRADGTRLRQLTFTDDVESDLVWSPDGTRIGYTSEDGVDGPSTIHVMSSRDGSTNIVVLGDSPNQEGHPELQDWGNDPNTLLFRGTHGGRPGLWTIRLDGTQFQFRGGNRAEYGNGAAYSPDGRSLVFQADLEGGCIFKSDAAGKNLVRLTQGCAEGVILTWSPDGRWIAWSGGEKGPTDAQMMAADGSQVHTIADGSDVAYVAWQPATTS